MAGMASSARRLLVYADGQQETPRNGNCKETSSLYLPFQIQEPRLSVYVRVSLATKDVVLGGQPGESKTVSEDSLTGLL